jgi:hypothetical protein
MIQTHRMAQFYARHPEHLISDEEFYLLWHRPARVLHPRRIEAERARRFARLVSAN